jgi:uncharacterized protein (DUF1697 family)
VTPKGAEPTHIALLRAVNVTGRNRVAMAELRALFSRLGFGDAQTLLQSGNVLFRGGARSAAVLERVFEAETEKRLGVETDYFVRTAAEWRKMVADNPFPAEAKRDPGRLVAVCLKEAPGTANVKALQAAITGREVVRAKGREAYIVYPDGQGRSRLTNALIEKHLGTRGTARNWNTVLKLAALLEA